MTPDDLRQGPLAQRIRRHRLVVVLRRVAPRTSLFELVDALADAGARIFEITLDADGASSDLAALRARLGHEVSVGAGTVRRAAQVAEARQAGAEFVVSPVLDVAVVRAALDVGLPCVPGAFTPTEIAAAWAAGATFVKLFPASAAGPELVRELRGPLPEVELIPTGGIGSANAASFLEAGAVAVGIGGALVRADADARRRLVSAVAGETA